MVKYLHHNVIHWALLAFIKGDIRQWFISNLYCQYPFNFAHPYQLLTKCTTFLEHFITWYFITWCFITWYFITWYVITWYCFLCLNLIITIQLRITKIYFLFILPTFFVGRNFFFFYGVDCDHDGMLEEQRELLVPHSNDQETPLQVAACLNASRSSPASENEISASQYSRNNLLLSAATSEISTTMSSSVSPNTDSLQHVPVFT